MCHVCLIDLLVFFLENYVWNQMLPPDDNSDNVSFHKNHKVCVWLRQLELNNVQRLWYHLEFYNRFSTR